MADYTLLLQQLFKDHINFGNDLETIVVIIKAHTCLSLMHVDDNNVYIIVYIIYMYIYVD